MRRAWLLLALLAPAAASAAPSYYGWGAGAFLQGPDATDVTAPTAVAAQITATTLTVTYSEAMSAGAGGTGGHAIASCSGGAVTPTYVSGSGSSQLTFSLSREPDPSETGCVLGYTQPTNGWEDAAGNDLATYSGQAITIRSACVELIGPVISPVVGPSVLALQCAQ